MLIQDIKPIINNDSAKNIIINSDSSISPAQRVIDLRAKDIIKANTVKEITATSIKGSFRVTAE